MNRPFSCTTVTLEETTLFLDMMMHFKKETQTHNTCPDYLENLMFHHLNCNALFSYTGQHFPSYSYLNIRSESRTPNQTFPKNALANKILHANVQQSLQIILKQKGGG